VLGVVAGVGDQGGEPVVDPDGVGQAQVVGDSEGAVVAVAEVFNPNLLDLHWGVGL
jgi:hypothetical protein